MTFQYSKTALAVNIQNQRLYSIDFTIFIKTFDYGIILKVESKLFEYVLKEICNKVPIRTLWTQEHPTDLSPEIDPWFLV